MPRRSADCGELTRWLTANLGRQALGALTGTDWRALEAAAHIIRLFYVSVEEDAALSAFHDVVMIMQPSTRYFAYHAIAWAGEWHFRDSLWARAGLPVLERIPLCKGEPAMRAREQE